MPNTVFKWYDRLIGDNPLGRMLTYPVAGYFGAKYGSKFLGSLLTNILKSRGMGVNQSDVDEMLANPATSEYAGIAGALGGALFAARPYWGAKSLGEFGKSIVNPSSVWSKVVPPKEYYTSKVSGNKSFFQNKHASVQGMEDAEMHPWEQHVFSTLSIPVNNSLDLVSKDRFLDPFAKNKTSQFIYNADNKSVGLISGKQLMQGAVKAGVAFVPAYFFGKTVGSLLALPEDVSDKISKMGGLAAALYNTGIISEG